VPTLLSFAVPITAALCLYATYVKLSARLLRYRVRWITSFAFAVIIWLIAVFTRFLDLGQPLVIAVGHSIVVLAAVLLLGGWFCSTRSADASGQPVGFGRAFGLSGLTFGLMFVTGGILFLLAHVLFRIQPPTP
jgi:hypothetical protein